MAFIRMRALVYIWIRPLHVSKGPIWKSIFLVITGSLAVSSILTVDEINDLVAFAEHIYDRTRYSNRNLYDKRHFFVYGVLHIYCVFEFSTEIILEYLILHEDAINKTNGMVLLVSCGQFCFHATVD